MLKRTPDKIIVFAGPSLHNIDEQLVESSKVLVYPPVKRGDISSLTAAFPPGNIAIVDGIFHSYPAVGHAEMLTAVGKGWNIWGLSSMGAIRACEMQRLGVRGFGEVYRRFTQDPEMSDDEVTLLHQAQAPYLPISEPLVHIREFLKHCQAKGHITPNQAQSTAHTLKHMWYGYRTLSRLREEMVKLAVPKDRIDILFSDFSQHRVKTKDLIDFLKLRPWAEE